MEDEKDYCEKELEGTRSLLLEALDEKKRLEVETDQLKSLLKREVAQFDTEMVKFILCIDRVPYFLYFTQCKYGNFCCSYTPCHHFGHRLY